MSDPVVELRWLLDVVTTADDIFSSLPPSVRDEIEAGESPRELARLAVALAGVSAASRRTLATALRSVVGDTRPADARLRLVR